MSEGHTANLGHAAGGTPGCTSLPIPVVRQAGSPGTEWVPHRSPCQAPVVGLSESAARSPRDEVVLHHAPQLKEARWIRLLDPRGTIALTL